MGGQSLGSKPGPAHVQSLDETLLAEQGSQPWSDTGIALYLSR